MNRMKRVWPYLLPFALLLTACSSSGRSAPLTFEQAAQLVLDEVVHPEELSQPTIVFGLSKPLQPADELHPYEKAGFEPFAEHIGIEDETWFFWIDDAPGAMFVHPNRFVLVKRDSGGLTVQEQQWWPVLNGEGLWTTEDTYWNVSDWAFSYQVSPPAHTPQAFNSLPRGISSVRALQTQSPGSAIVINGWEKGETLQQDMADSSDQMHDILTEAGFDTTYLGPKEDSNPDRNGEATPNARYDWLYRKASELRPSQTLFIYITGHGGVDKNGVGVIGSVFENLLTDTLKAFDPGVHIIVVLDSCHSGSFADSLSGVADVTIASTDSTSPAYGDIDDMGGKKDSNPEDRGLEYTSGFVEDWRQILADPAETSRVRQVASRQGLNFWETLAPQSHVSAVEKDLANNLGWTGPVVVYGKPQTRIQWTPTPAPTPIPHVGDTRTYQAQTSIKEDKEGHGDHIDMPTSLEMQLEWISSGIRFDAGYPWVAVEGALKADGSFETYGTGTVAGYSGVSVSFEGQILGDTLIGTYGMGVNGGLPSSLPIYYSIDAQLQLSPTSTPQPAPDELSSVQDFYSGWNSAFEAQDVTTLLELLHPAVIDLYGFDACRSYLESVIVNPTQVEVLDVKDAGTWMWEIDGLQVSVENAFGVDVAISSGGQTFTREAHLALTISGTLGELAWFTDCGDPAAVVVEAAPTEILTASPVPSTATPQPIGEAPEVKSGTMQVSTPASTSTSFLIVGGLLGLGVLTAILWWASQEMTWPRAALGEITEPIEVGDRTYQLKTEAQCDKPCFEVRAAIRRPHRIRIVEVKALTLHKKTGGVLDENVVPGRLVDEQNVMREFRSNYDVPATHDGTGKEFLYREGRCADGCRCEVPPGAKPSRHRRTTRRLHFTFVKEFVRTLQAAITDPKTGQSVLPDPNFMRPDEIERYLSDADLLLPHQPGQPYRVKTIVRYQVTLRVPVELRKYDGRCRPFQFDPSTGRV